MQEVVGPGALADLASIIQAHSANSVLLVHGLSFNGCGAAHSVRAALSGKRGRIF